MRVGLGGGGKKADPAHELMIGGEKGKPLGQRDAAHPDVETRVRGGGMSCLEKELHELSHREEDFIVGGAHGESIAELPEQARLRVVEGGPRKEDSRQVDGEQGAGLGSHLQHDGEGLIESSARVQDLADEIIALKQSEVEGDFTAAEDKAFGLVAAEFVGAGFDVVLDANFGLSEGAEARSG